jgi:membrane complex biogenesis BtpA family protein
MASALFGRGQGTLVGMLHLPALPGSALHRGETLREIESRTVAEAECLAEAGFHALMLQNTGQGPPGKDADVATVAQLAVIGHAVRSAVRLPLGINVLKNGVETALAVAAAVDASFIRIKVYVGAIVGSEGIVEGRAQAALDERHRLGLDDVAILADVLDRTSRPLGDAPLAELADWAVRHGHADALVITGRDIRETAAMLDDVRNAVEVPLVVGGGATPDNVGSLLQQADSIIVGGALKDEASYDAPISLERARAFVAAARSGRPVA